jgi:hypothetical protein
MLQPVLMWTSARQAALATVMLFAPTLLGRTRVRVTQAISAMEQLALYVMALTNIKTMLDSHHARLVIMEHLVLPQLE